MTQLWNTLPASEKARRLNLQAVDEEDILDDSIARYILNYERKPSEGVPEQALTVRLVEHLGDSILQYLEDLNRQKAGWLQPIVELGAYKVSTILCHTIFDTLICSGSLTFDLKKERRGGRVMAVELARAMVSALISSAEYAIAKGENREEWNRLARTKKVWTERAIANFIKKHPPTEKLDLSRKARFQLGQHLVLMLDKAGILKCVLSWESASKSMQYVELSDDVYNGLVEAHSHFMNHAQLRYRPMIVPPVPHTEKCDGGRLNPNLRKSIVQGGYVFFQGEEFVSETRRSKASEPVRRGLNALMATEWCVNDRVFEVMEYMFKNNLRHANLPGTEKSDILLQDLIETDDPEALAEMKLNRRLAWTEWFHRENDRVRMYLRLSIARKFLQAGFHFYHVYTCDFRGRGYTDTDLLSPQASDHDRALCLFAVPRKQTERGRWWLKVHVANCFDQDKISFDDRVKWVDANMDMLRDIHNDPYSSISLWATDTTDGFRVKKDKSFQRLAAVFELFRTDGMTQLPIQLDGSCNGIQHWAAISRNTRLGQRVNLLKSDKPEDVYQEVADNCHRIAKESNDPWHKTFLQVWETPKDWRKVVKRSVMTDPYGVTDRGIMNALVADGFVKNFDKKGAAAFELAKLICEGKAELLSVPNECKAWLKHAAETIGNMGHHLVWQTSLGFEVHHEYNPLEVYYFRMRVPNSWHRFLGMSWGEYTREGVDVRAAKNGIPPNFIHSYDADHMWATINECLDGGLESFSFIHDSYGTYATDVDVLREATRTQFVRIHKTNVLQDLKEQLEARFNISLPPVPEVGDLDINQVLESEYFFH